MKNCVISAICLLLLASCSKEREYTATGYFEATEVTLSARTPGIILEADFEEGDRLKVNQRIALIDTMSLHFNFLQISHQLSATKAGIPDVALQLAALRQERSKQVEERDRVSRLLAGGAGTQKQLDDINSAIRVLDDRIRAQQSSLDKTVLATDDKSMALAMQLEQVLININDCSIVTPVEGTVLTKYVEAGEYVAPGRPIAKIADLNRIYLRAYYTSLQLASIKIGDDVTVVADYGGDEWHEYTGKIIWISAESEFTPKNIQTNDTRANLVYAVKIAVDNNDGLLKIGGFGGVKQ